MLSGLHSSVGRESHSAEQTCEILNLIVGVLQKCALLVVLFVESTALLDFALPFCSGIELRFPSTLQLNAKTRCKTDKHIHHSTSTPLLLFGSSRTQASLLP